MADSNRSTADSKSHRRASAFPLELATVHACRTTEEADSLLGNPGTGYVYQRDGHANADQLAARCGQLHGADVAVMTSSGMAAMATVLLSLLKQGDHIVASEQLYGKSLTLMENEGCRVGWSTTRVDSTDLDAVERAMQKETRLIVVETISNPRLRVANLEQLAKIAHQYQVGLLVDNTFATPVVCRPLEWGADLVVESLTKMMNGHGDVTLGMVGARAEFAQRLLPVTTTWGLGAAPFDCWLAARGLKTLNLRVEQANRTANQVARFLAEHPRVIQVDFPGLHEHPDHALAKQLFSTTAAGGPSEARFGNMITFQIAGDSNTVNRFFAQAGEIPFFPSLGDTSTSFSHPVSTSHRGLEPDERSRLGIVPTTIRLSVGIEPADWVVKSLEKGLDGLDA